MCRFHLQFERMVLSTANRRFFRYNLLLMLRRSASHSKGHFAYQDFIQNGATQSLNVFPVWFGENGQSRVMGHLQCWTENEDRHCFCGSGTVLMRMLPTSLPPKSNTAHALAPDPTLPL